MMRMEWMPAATKFPIPSVDAPNVSGARDFGLLPADIDPRDGVADVSALRRDVEAGNVPRLYVFDPGPSGSIGDVSWIVAARASGKLPLLIVQGVVMTELTRAADFVLPGASWVEKEGTYTNDQGRLQAAARVLAPPTDAMEDWQILVNLGISLGVTFSYTSTAHVRSHIAARMSDVPGYAAITDLVFRHPVAARSWLQVSNPSERWKWDFLFKDLPPVKFNGTSEPSSPPDSTSTEVGGTE